MKGLATQTTILLVIGIIVLAVALYVLVFLEDLDSLFLSEDQRILRQYSTCALALCTDGVKKDGTVSPMVNKVGCLERDGTICIRSCADVGKDYFSDPKIKSSRGVEVVSDQIHFCGEDVALEFEFKGFGGTVSLSSGQMDKISRKPEWLCKPLRIPFTDMYIDDITGSVSGFTTSDFQYFAPPFGPFNPFSSINENRNCVMLTTLADNPRTLLYNVISPDEKAYGGCFASIVTDKEDKFEKLITPILEYETPNEKRHPGAIYLNKSEFTSGENPDCELIPKKQVISSEITDEQIAEAGEDYENVRASVGGGGPTYTPFEKLSTIQKREVAYQYLSRKINSDKFTIEIPRCNFKTVDKNGEKIKYSVWSDTATLPLTPLGIASSCKTVTLDRGNLGSVGDTSDSGKVKDIVMSVGGGAYAQGETVKITGKIELESGDISEDKFTLEITNLNIPPSTPLLIKKSEIKFNEDGSFELEYKITDDTAIGTVFQLTATYNGYTKDTNFSVVKEEESESG